jgi:hypothetical protein
MNRFIPAKVIGFFDYAAALLLISTPFWAFDPTNPLNSSKGAALFTPFYFGVLVLVMTFFTNYEFGVIKAVPLKLHSALYIVAGSFVFFSPFMYNFAGVILWPHLLIGFYIVFSGAFIKIEEHHEYNPFQTPTHSAH